MKLDFTRSNVAENTLDVSQPGQSSFDHYHKHHNSLPLGKFMPVDVTPLMPNSVLSGVINPEYTLEVIGMPQIGSLRLDTHSIAVSARRINRDWVSLIEGDIATIPTFNSAQVFCTLLFRLLQDPEDTFVAYNGRNQLLGVLDVFLGSSSAYFYAAVIKTYKFWIDQTINSDNEFGYLADWMNVEVHRLELLKDGPVVPILQAVYEVMLPYFGEGSIMDNLRYPTFTYYSRARVLGEQMFNIRQTDFVTGYRYDTNLFVKDTIATGTDEIPTDGCICNEMMLRAQYAAYFDCLRNWHVEDKHKMPNPTQWSGASLFFAMGSAVDPRPYMCYLLPRYRFFGSDAFTTVQTDDVFRHVFNPIFSSFGPPESDQQIIVTSDGGIPHTIDGVLNGIYQVLLNGVSSVFPQGLFRRSTGTQTDIITYQNDLQTMRRSGMLERYLARDYFFPDTYEGQMLARYGVSSSDILGQTSRYISGTEKFISGEQLLASTNGTDGVTGTPAGTRTFAGGASDSGSITLSSGGDFVYLVTFASLQPIVTYDSLDMHLVEHTRADLPFPEFADDTRVEISARDMIRHFQGDTSLLGYVPRYYQWRTSMDSVHGKWLRDYRSMIWLRDWYSTVSSVVTDPDIQPADIITGSPFNIDAYGLHVHVQLDAFNGSLLPDDSIAYGKVEFNFAISAPLPAAVEHI